MTQPCKTPFLISLLFIPLFLAACSTNPATGEQQFTALMPAGQEAAIGAQEHAKIEQTFGKFIDGPLHTYVNTIGQKVAQNTERPDVQYRFYVIDSPMVNAFALPGGYIYVTRGLMALANNEAELAAVIGHEIAHVTARHSAERMSQGFLTQLGAVVLSAATDSAGIARAANLGSNLYLKSYSRDQEHQADELGVRYLHRAGYDGFAMASFLNSMGMHTNLEAKIAGRNAPQANWFSTHPDTGNRVAEASAAATTYGANAQKLKRNEYFNALNGMVYGDSASQGFMKGQTFWHPDMGFTFTFPSGFQVNNQPTQIIGLHKGSGAVILFDAAGDKSNPDPLTFLSRIWMKGENIRNLESVTVNGMRAATGSFPGTVNGKSVTVQLMAIEWKPGQFFRFQIAVPNNLDSASLDALKKTTYSLRRMTASEKQSVKPMRLQIITARSGDTVASLAARMPFESYRQERFRVLNGLSPNQGVAVGQKYKTIVQ